MRYVVVASLFFSAAVEAQEFGSLQKYAEYFGNSSFGPVQTKESTHFKVSWVHPRDGLIAKRLLEYMEAARESLKSKFSMAMSETRKAPIEIYPNLKSFSEVSQLALSRFRATGTIALTLDQRLMILSPRNLAGGYSWAETVVHEYAHYMIREITASYIPIWLHEGVAQLFQEYPRNLVAKLKPSQWGLFKKRRKAHSLLSLKTLQEPFPYRETPEEAELAYIQALLFVQWLDQKCGAVNLIVTAKKMKSIEKALGSCSGMSYESLESSFVPKIMDNVSVPTSSDVEFYARSFDQSDPMEFEGRKADKTAQNLAQLSEELFNQGRYRASGIEMNKALQATVVSPPSWRRHLALSLNKSGQAKKTKEVLEALLKDYPTDAAAWMLMGELDLKKQDEKAAYLAFLEAFYQNPFLEGLESSMGQLSQKYPDFEKIIIP
ncbi:MAG: hypothetical protein COV44_04980 [Deltaproteobacteria bacterium CG11_big_fil_rev_8_21_14_0_20_45_16]|nr:MAG: hypothetical protein COV44_04980 [Deltaproteobacteria bacterium CG11_big_fil_rev_8_21_14_0_20_45_16]